jgi:transcription antitermination factor NusA-like protein
MPSYLPQPSSTGSVDLSAIKPVSSGSMNIADAIAKARNIAADHGIAYSGMSLDRMAYPYFVHLLTRSTALPRNDPRAGGRRSRSRSPRRNSYNANPYRDERREEPRRGAFRRTPSPDRSGFRGSRDPPAGFRSNDSETETIRVKSALVGLIIGRNGENLRKVESETGARVQFIQAKDSHVTERQCTISGPLRARESAKEAIFRVIDENGGSTSQEKGAYTAGMPGRAKVNLPALREGEASTQVMVPDRTVGLIIGRGGETIKDLQERSGCHVNIVGENKSVNGLRPVNLIGSEQATAIAKELILEIVESDNKSGAPSGAGGPPRDRPFDGGSQNRNMGGGGGGGRDLVEKTIQVPSEAVGMIIGKGGETIKEMQRASSCKINVNQPKPPDVTRNIDLSGTPQAMEDAERMIWEKVETVRQRDSAAGRPHGREQGASQYDAYSQPQQPSSGYGQYYGASGAGQAAAQPSAYQMPGQQAGMTGQQPSSDQNASEQYAQWYAQWYASQLANLQGQPGANPGAQ